MAMQTGQTGQPQDDVAVAGEEFEVLLVSDSEEPGYTVLVPALPGCVTEGADWDEALYMAEEVIALFLRVAGRPETMGDEKGRLERDWTAAGCRVDTTVVRVFVD